MSIAIAVHEANTIEKMNLKLVVCEKDADYYKDAVKRFKNFLSGHNPIPFPETEPEKQHPTLFSNEKPKISTVHGSYERTVIPE